MYPVFLAALRLNFLHGLAQTLHGNVEHALALDLAGSQRDFLDMLLEELPAHFRGAC
jgi:hypothetical protein